MTSASTEEIEVYGIFQGGGAKGFAYVGALKELEETRFIVNGKDAKIKFLGVAGTSAGSITAALVAAGYTADELYNPLAPAGQRGLFDCDITKYFKHWRTIQRIRDTQENIAVLSNLIITNWSQWWLIWIRLFVYLYKQVAKVWVFLLTICALIRFWSSRGCIDNTEFCEWLNEKIVEKLKMKEPTFQMTGVKRYVHFDEIEKVTNIRLKIVASQISRKTMLTFSATSTGREVSVADAVGASISIPFIFRYKELLDGEKFVDGGLASNCPAWAFEDEQIGQRKTTLVFLLQDKDGDPAIQGAPRRKKNTFLDYLSEVGATVLEAEHFLSTMNIEEMVEITVKTSAGLLEFDMNDTRKNYVYNEGKSSSHTAFATWMP